MATFQSVELAAGPEAPNEPTERRGRVRHDVASYTFDGTEVAADVIELFTLPLNARVLGLVVAVDEIDGSADGATTPTDLRVGDADDDNRYVINLSPDTSSGAREVAGILNDSSNAGFNRSVLIDVENKRTIQVLIDAIDAEAGPTLEASVLYVID